MIPATGSLGILQEIIGKIKKHFGRNTASTKSPGLPRTGSFRTGLFDLGVDNEIKVDFSMSKLII
jgi:hypothetical protein